MKKFTDEEKDQIIREYFGPAGAGENPRCPFCGEVLDFDSGFRSDISAFRIRVSCSDCGAGFVWEQHRPEQPWRPIHLQYFLERYRLGDVLRCPLDDCSVAYTEFSDGVIEFRCPYCNRRGRTRQPGHLIDLQVS